MTDGAVVQVSRRRVFVSSVVEGFEEFREAARRGIEAAGAYPVLVNEDFPSLSTSSRNACLDAIDSCDYLLSISGARGGWTAPSGLLVVEEELEHARARNVPVLALVQDTPRDPEAERFARRLSDYVDGRFRTTFHTPAELAEQVARAVRERIGTVPSGDVVERDLTSFFPASRRDAGTMTMLRLVLVPDRDGELIDPVRIASSELEEQLYELGHASSVKLFSYSRPKSKQLKSSTLVINQSEGDGHRHDEGEFVQLELEESGTLAIEANVTGRVLRGVQGSMVDSMVVAYEDIEGVLSSIFRFAAALYGKLDPYQRHERFHFNAGLRGLGFRKLERNPQPRTQMGMSMRSVDSVLAYDRSRAISRTSLSDPSSEIERTLALFARKTAI